MDLKKQMVTAWLDYTTFEVEHDYDYKEKWDLYYKYAALRDQLYDSQKAAAPNKLVNKKAS